MGGTMRLGSDPVKVVEGTLAERAYGEPVVYERHRHPLPHLQRCPQRMGTPCKGDIRRPRRVL